jgi:peptidoglycan/xylan/chitin deacetylase (PgdA/CDA1 family)
MRYNLRLGMSMIFLLLFLSRAVYGADNIKILLYHDLAADAFGEGDNGDYCTTGVKFERDITDALSLGYKSLSLADYYRGNYKPEERYFIITFDDGYLSNYTIAFPILKKYRIYGDIFVITDYTGLSNHFSWRQGQVMEDSGFVTLYAHTTRHQRSDNYTPADYRKLVTRSFDLLSRKLADDRYKIFAYPEGVYSSESAAALSGAGIVMQLVQTLPDRDCAAYGLHARHSVSLQTDIKAILETQYPGV